MLWNFNPSYNLQIESRYFLQGITSIHPNEAELWHEYTYLAQSNQLPIRVFYVPFWSNKDSDNFPKAGERHGPFLSSDRVKVWYLGVTQVTFQYNLLRDYQ